MVQRLLSLQLCFIHQRPCYPSEPDWMDGKVHGLSGFFWSSCTSPTWEFPFFRFFFSESLRGVFVSLAFKILKKGARDQAPETSFEIAKHFVSEFNLHDTNFIPPWVFCAFFCFPHGFCCLKIRLPAYHVTKKTPHFRRWFSTWGPLTSIRGLWLAVLHLHWRRQAAYGFLTFLFFWGLAGPLVFLPGFGLQESPPKNHQDWWGYGQGPSGGWERLDPQENRRTCDFTHFSGKLLWGLGKQCILN